MKKNNFVTTFLIGGSIGVTLARISYIFANILMGRVTQDVKDLIVSFFLTFAWGGVCITIASMSIKTIEHRDMKSKERQKILKKQLKGMIAIISWFAIFLVVYIVKKNTIGTILALSFITVFALWAYGYLLAYLNLKNNMAMINKRDNQVEHY